MLSESRDAGHSGDIAKKLTVKLWGKGVYAKDDKGSAATQYFTRHAGQFIYSKLDFLNSAFGVVPKSLESYESTADLPAFDCLGVDPYFMFYRAIQPSFYLTNGMIADGSRKAKRIHVETFLDMPLDLPSIEEQHQVARYFIQLDHLITLHQRKCETLQKFKKSMLQKMFPKNGSCFPEIRFAGFTDAWELRKLSLSFDILQNNTLSRSELSIENGAARNVHYGDILVKYGEVLDLKTEELPFIQSSQTVDKLKGSFLQNGDIIMADTAEDETAGKCTEIANLDNMNVLAGLHTIPLRPKQKYAVGYLGYYMNSGSFHDKLLPLMQGTKVTSISKSALQGMSILRPADLEEQRQIGTYFRTLDHLITLHQRKLETLKKLKKAMLQKMFI